MIHAHLCIGQETDFIYGQLVNAGNQTPISFAHITIKNKAKGTISNMDGGFRIPVQYYKLGDTLVISSIGYSSKKIPLLSLNQNLRNVIILLRKEEVLDEISLGTSKNKSSRDRQDGQSRKKRLRAKDIIQLALDRIPENYPYAPFSYVGYYRDYQMKQGNYFNLNEAVMHIFDAGFGASDSVETQTRLYKYEKNTTFPEDPISAMPYDYVNRMKFIYHTELGTPIAGRNEYTLLRIHDALRNHNINTYDFVNRLDLDFIKNHKFKFLPETSIDRIPLYAINLIKRWNDFTAIGKIFISKGDYKIYKMQYAVYDKSGPLESKKEQQTISKQSVKYDKNLGKLLYEIIVEYQLYNGIMYPNYISFNNSFISLKPIDFFPIDIEITKTNLIKLTFSQNPMQNYAMKKENYRMWYNYKQLKIDRIEISNNIVRLYLDKETLIEATQNDMIEEFDHNKFKISISNIYNFYGYKIKPNRPFRNFKQFKEFHVGKLDEHTKNQAANNYLYRSYNPYKEWNIRVDSIYNKYANKAVDTLYQYKSYYQYREFFVQELKLNTKKRLDTFYMLKSQPIFKNQPIAPYVNLKDYWMNTPLKN